VDRCPFLADPGVPQRRAHRARILSPSGREAVIDLREPLRVFRRSDLNSLLQKRAGRAGAEIRFERITGFVREGPGWRLRDASGREERADFLVGADGGAGISRRRLAGDVALPGRSVGVGYFVQGYTSDEIVLRFLPDLDGYIWIFPRPDHLAAGICGPPGTGAGNLLIRRLEEFLIDHLGVSSLRRVVRYGANIPCYAQDSAAPPALAGNGWALVGDAAGLVDPLTREGIHQALESARLLAECLCAGNARGYARAWKEGTGAEMAWAASHKGLFFSLPFIESFTLLSGASASVGHVVSDLIAGRQEYRTLRRRLTRLAPRAAGALAVSALRRVLPGRRRFPPAGFFPVAG
jgi:flavin-dependent dehydrogenase